MKNRFHVSMAALLLALCPAKPAMADITSCTTIDVPNAVDTLAAGVNNIGQIVGIYQVADGSLHGFLYSGGIFTNIDDPNATSGSAAAGINNLGQIVGAYNLSLIAGEGHQLEGAHGFVKSGGTFTDINFPGASNTTPHKINDFSRIVGVYRVGNAEAHGFTDFGGVLSTLDFPGTFSTQDNGINGAGSIVGRYRLSAGAPKQGFLDKSGTFSTIDFPGATQTVASDINNFGEIVGFYQTDNGTFGFLDHGGSFSTVACLGATSTEAFGMNDEGNIVGTYADQNGALHGFETSLPAATKLFVDVRPQSCPNPINFGAQGSLPVAILGTNSFNVATVDPSSVRLQGVPALRSALEDLATPFTGSFVNAKSCTTAGRDGFTDLVLIFSNQAVSAALGSVTNGQVLVLTLTGNLLPQFGSTPITGQDVVVVSKQ